MNKETKAKTVKVELENGLNLWRKRVLKVQSQSITKAEGRLKEELEKKKEKLMDERSKKENKIRILKKEQMKKERKSVKNTEKMLENKDTKVRFVDKILL